jgi:capsular polysaccharide biosynthesis protein
MNPIFFQNRLETREVLHLDNSEADISVCLKIDNGIIHHNGHIFTHQQRHFTCGKWFNRPTKTSIVDTYKDKHIVSLLQIWNDSFQHVTFDTLPKIPMLKSLLEKDDKVFILTMSNIQKNLLVDFGRIPEDRIIVRDRPDVSYTTKIAYYIAFVNSEGHSVKMGSSGCGHLNSYLREPPADNNYVCYISRRGNNKRVIDIEQENHLVKNLIKKCNECNKQLIIIINPKNPQEIKDILGKCCLMISVHGGAMGNMIWANKDTRIIEIIPRESLGERPCFYYLSRTLGLQYSYFEPDEFDFNSNASVKINVDKLIEACSP